MQVKILGSGTPAPSLRRQGSGYVVQIGSELLVFDHGPGAHSRFLEAGLRARDVGHLFLTHYHYDHILDVPRLALTRWDHGPSDQAPLKVFGPNPLDAILDGFFGPEGAFAPDIYARTHSPASQSVFEVRGGNGPRPGPRFDPRQVAPGDVIEGRNWRVVVGPTQHVQPTLDCIAYRIEADDEVLVYSGDTGGVFKPFIDFAKGADVLILMNHFLSGQEASPEYRIMSGSHLDNAEVAQKAGVGMLVLTHLQPDLDVPSVRERMVAEMAHIYQGPIVVGEDLMDVPMQPPVMTTAD